MSPIGYIILGIAIAAIAVLGFLLLQKKQVQGGTPDETAKAQAALQAASDALAQKVVILAKTEEQKQKLNDIMKNPDITERLNQLAAALKDL